MRKYILSIIILMTMSHSFAQHKSMTDTVYTIKAIEVTGMAKNRVDILPLNVPLEYLPVTVNTLSNKILDERGITNIQDAVKFLPGTRMRTTYGAYQQFSVRGFDYTPIMIDGIRDERTSINNSTPLPDLSSTESIELIKGPASVLYGHSVVGGLLNIVRKSPTAQRMAAARMSYGSWDNKQAMMEFGGNVYKSLNYRATLNYSDSEGYRYTNDKRFSGYLALSAQLDAKQSLDFRGGFNRDNYGTEIGLPANMSYEIYNTSDGSTFLNAGDMLPNLNRRARYNNESDFMKNNGTNLMLKYKNNISDAIKIENRLAYTHDNIDYFSTEELSYLTSDSPIYKNYYLTSTGTKKYIALDTVQLTYPLRFAYTLDVINEQLEASGKLGFGNGMKYNYLAGYNFVVMFRDRYRGYGKDKDGTSYPLSHYIDGPGLNSKVPVYNPHSMGYMDPSFGPVTVNRTFTHSVYLQNLLEVSEQLKIMASGRFDYFDFWSAEARSVDGKREYKDKDPYTKVNSSAFTYRLGAVYLPIEGVSVYGSLANFFMPYRDLPDQSTNIYIDESGNRFYPKSGSEVFKPQTGYQAEVGSRYRLSNIFEASASVYYIRKNNEKATIASKYVDPDDGKTQKNIVGIIGGSESKGFELEFNANPVNGLLLNFGYAYTDATVREMKTIVFDGKTYSDTGKGARLANAPVNTFFSAGSYTFIKGVLKDLSFNYTVSFMDKVHRDLTKSVTYPSYWLTDMGVSYELKNGIGLSMVVNNIFDKKYYNQSLGKQMVPSNPRNYLATISYRLK